MLLTHLLAILLLAAPPDTTPWQIIDSATVVWLPGGKPYTLIIAVPTREEFGNDSVPRLRIRVPGRPDFLLNPPGGLSTMTEGMPLNKFRATDNLVRSNYLYLAPKLRGVHGEPVLIVFPPAGDGDAGRPYFIALDSSGFPGVILKVDFKEITEFTDLDGDGAAEIVLKQGYTEIDGKCMRTYDPFFVFKISPDHFGTATWSRELSALYNRAHYYGWADPDSGPYNVINSCPGQKPIIVKQSP